LFESNIFYIIFAFVNAISQFIATTFRPELVKVADKLFGVTHKNRVSRVNAISENDALEFINQDQTQNAE